MPEPIGFKITRWSVVAPPTYAELQKRLVQEGLFPYGWSNDPGDIYLPHWHAYDKVLYVVSGSITWILPELQQTIETQAGDRIDLARGTLHAARVGPQGVVCLEGQIV